MWQFSSPEAMPPTSCAEQVLQQLPPARPLPPLHLSRKMLKVTDTYENIQKDICNSSSL